MTTLNSAIKGIWQNKKKALLVGAVITLLPFLLIGFLLLFLFLLLLSLFGGGETGLDDSVGTIEGVKYAKHINDAAQKYEVSPALVAGIIKVESDFRPELKSPKDATGLMQIMPFNAKGADLLDPRENIMRGTQIIASHLKKYGGNLELSLAAYNAGPGAVAKYHNQVPPYKETQNYVKKVQKYYEKYQLQVVNGKIQEGPIGKGQLAYPAKSKISCGFTCYKNHGGIDFSGRGDRSIFAAGDGTVIEKRDLDGRSYGTLVIIDHGGGIQTAYAHMEWKDIQVETGQRVKRGQKIAKMGNNGNSSGTHLHFEVRKDGKQVDPLPYLKKKK